MSLDLVATTWQIAREEGFDKDGNVADRPDLIPLGRDLISQKWEFWHHPSGRRPQQVGNTFRLDADSGIIMIFIPGGDRWFGTQWATSNEPNYCTRKEIKADDQGPPFLAHVEPFYIGKYETTVAQWARLNHAQPPGSLDECLLPLTNESWITINSVLARQDPALLLPNELQWELACRADSQKDWCFGDDDEVSQLVDHCYYRANSFQSVQAVGCKRPNAFGLFDMHGNAWEWCSNSMVKYPTDEQTIDLDPNDDRVMRGGSHRYPDEWSRSAARYAESKNKKIGSVGFRVALRARCP